MSDYTWECVPRVAVRITEGYESDPIYGEYIFVGYALEVWGGNICGVCERYPGLSCWEPFMIEVVPHPTNDADLMRRIEEAKNAI